MAITFGTSGVPSQITINFDSVFSTSLAAYKKTLVDNIAATNAFFYKMLKSDFYEAQAGGTDIRVPLMYGLAAADWYDGYDELSTLPTDGITEAVYQWRQLAVPVAYNMKEVKQNKQRIVNLVKSRIQQAELGIQEKWATAFFQGAGGSTITTAQTSSVNGSSGITPLPLLISYDTTGSVTVGNIDQSTSTWWANKKKESAATTYEGLVLEMQNIYNSASLGTGGEPDLISCDQVTFELYQQALWQKFRQTREDINFPFNHIMFKNARIVMEDKVPDAYSGTVTTTYGSAYYFNTKFFRIIYESESNFEMLKDDEGKTFQKPINGDSRVGHVAWMGNICVTNRRKQGVHGKIARTLT